MVVVERIELSLTAYQTVFLPLKDTTMWCLPRVSIPLESKDNGFTVRPASLTDYAGIYKVESPTGIEPVALAWKARMLPLHQ